MVNQIIKQGIMLASCLYETWQNSEDEEMDADMHLEMGR